MANLQQNFPNISTQLVDPKTGQITPQWQYFLNSLFQRTGGPSGGAGGPITTITVGASPFVYTATTTTYVWLEQGSYAEVTFNRSGVILNYGFATRGIFPVVSGDILTFTYSSLTPILYTL